MNNYRLVISSWEAVQMQSVLECLDVQYKIRSLVNGRYFIKVWANDTDATTLNLMNLQGEI